MSWQEGWLDRYYRSRPGWCDGTTLFHESLCRVHVPHGARILEIGAGPTNATSRFLATLGELHGIDVSEEVRGNAHLASSGIIKDGRFPFPDESFDFAVSNFVVEHVDDAVVHLSEVRRVLKPGAHYAFRTPNLWHYVALASRFTSHRVHVLLANRLRGLDPSHHDPWPTVYAMNTPEAVRRAAASVGLDVARLDLVEKEPSYGMIARPLFLAFMAYERAVNATARLAPFRANLFVVLRRPSPAGDRGHAGGLRSGDLVGVA
jgi:SAM-dependent methyltransferase